MSRDIRELCRGTGHPQLHQILKFYALDSILGIDKGKSNRANCYSNS